MAATRSNFNLKGVKKSIASTSASDRTNSGFWWLTRKIYPWISTKTYPRISTKILPQNFSKNLLEDFPKNLPEDFSKNLLEDFSKNLPEDFSNRWCYPLLTCALSRASFPRTGTNIKYHHKKTSKTIKIITWWKTNRSKDLTLRGRRKAGQAIFQAGILKDLT